MSLFISFEGPDGSGKSTQARLLGEALRRRGYDVIETREPGGTELGEAMRDFLLSPAAAHASPLAQAFLLSTSRAELIDKVIRPALQAGRAVIVDRFSDSTVAYQGYGLGLDPDVVHTLTAIATGGLRPDVTVYVDIDPETGASRSAARGERNWLDERSVNFQERVRAGYRALIAEDPRRWICVKGDAAPEEVHDGILRQLEPLFEAARNRA